MFARGIALLVGLTMSISASAQTPPASLVLEAKIPLGQVSGRIDHLAIDLKRQRLLVAELGNDSVGVVDLVAGKVLRTLTGLSEPQGVAYEPTSDTVYVANANDGSVRIFRGEDLSPVGRVDLGDDADNVRIDPSQNRVLVGYGKGALAVIDPRTRTKIGDIRLKAHPEGFQIDDSGARAFVNLPAAREIGIVDLGKGEVIGTMPTQGDYSNFPMALDRESHRVLVGFRSPARLLALSTTDNAVVADVDTCGDADDVFVDAKRRRVYVTCGAGQVDVFEQQGGGYQRLGNVGTAPGARTSLFVPELDHLYVASRAAGREPAAIWVFRPVP